MKLYLAGPYASRFYLKRAVAPLLRALGHDVTSSWINEPASGTETWEYLRARRMGSIIADPLTDSLLQKIADRDVLDLHTADTVLRFPNSANSASSGGKFVETGLAINGSLEICLIGSRECIFDYLPFVKTFSTVDDFLIQYLDASEEFIAEWRKVNEVSATPTGY